MRCASYALLPGRHASVFNCHGDVYDGHILADVINCDGLRLERLTQAWNCLVDSNGGRSRSMKHLHQSA